jgi:hypothetical protein
MNLLEASVADPSLDDNRASLEVWQTDAWPRGSIWFETQLFKGSRPGAAATTGEGTVRLLRVISKPRCDVRTLALPGKSGDVVERRSPT